MSTLKPLARSYGLVFRTLFSATIIASSAAVGIAAAPVEITTCTQPNVSGKAILMADLDCSGPGHAVILEGPTKLDLNGHTIKAGPGRSGVLCLAKCKISGPGIISDSQVGVYMSRGVVEDLTIENCVTGIEAPVDGRVVMRGARIQFNEEQGVRADRYAKAFDSVIVSNGGSGVEVRSGDFGTCLALLKDSDVVGNGTSPSCGVDFECADVAACKRPKVSRGSHCDTSLDLSSDPPTESWGVCSLD